MPYKPIDTSTKVRVVRGYFSGEKICLLAHKYQVDRDSIHLWINKVESSLPQLLAPRKTGPKTAAGAQERSAREKLRRLQKKFDELSRISQLTVSTRPLPEARPSRCPKCGGAHIVKNGAYLVRGERATRSLTTDRKGFVQRFLCRDCGTSLYLVKKK